MIGLIILLQPQGRYSEAGSQQSISPASSLVGSEDEEDEELTATWINKGVQASSPTRPFSSRFFAASPPTRRGTPPTRRGSAWAPSSHDIGRDGRVSAIPELQRGVTSSFLNMGGLENTEHTPPRDFSCSKIERCTKNKPN